MIYKFPYTDLYSLNLDWMIQAMKEMQAIVEPLDRVVNSVNNMTGDVVITKAFLLNILESMVSKFNGRAGDVTLTAADVNNTMIDITWTSDPGDVIGDIQQNVLDQMYAAGKRVLIFVNNQGVPDQIYFLTLVGDVVTPQIYSPTAALAGVASFNGQTGAVTATGSDLDTANDNDTPISESIEDLQTAVNQQSQQILNLGPYNGLDSDSTIAALSAAQGKALQTSKMDNARIRIYKLKGVTIEPNSTVQVNFNLPYNNKRKLIGAYLGIYPLPYRDITFVETFSYEGILTIANGNSNWANYEVSIVVTYEED